MLQKSFLAKAALTLAGFALVAGTPAIAMAQEEGGTKTAHELRVDYNKAVKVRPSPSCRSRSACRLQDEWERVVQDRSGLARHEVCGARPQQQSVRDAAGADRPGQRQAGRADRAEPERHPADEGAEAGREPRARMSSRSTCPRTTSRTPSSAPTGMRSARLLAEDVVKQCGTGSGKSGKVSIVQGELTAAASVDQIGGIMDMFKKDPAIKVVSNQAANWDANAALNITSTVIQQNPDLCASIGFWGIMESGAAQAIRNAGKIDQVKGLCIGRRLAARLRPGQPGELL